ncbi:hypothetical protein DOTSEDRAFT_70439, partial [Dothistroma septosporum NZE10]
MCQPHELKVPAFGLHHNVASSLPRCLASVHTTAGSSDQELQPFHNSERQMSSIDLVFNNNLEPAPITSIDVQPTSAPAGNSVGSEEMEAPASALGDGASAAATDRPAQSTAANALSVLLAALPSGLRSSIVSEFVATHTTSTRTTLTPTPSTRSTTTSLSITLFTSTRASSTSSSTPAATTTAAPPADSQQTSHGSIAGVVTGVVAGAVLIILAIVLMIRRSRQGKAPFGPRGSQRSRGSGRAYPEVAWLYDPSPTPPHEPRVYPQEESGASLLPQASRTQEMTTAGR